MKDESIKSMSSVLDEFFVIKKDLISSLNSFEELLNDFDREKKVIAEENKKTSFLFNSLNFFGIGETMHSTLIANLLNPNAEHGQGNLFLNIFLDKIGITYEPNDRWIVTAEKGRIDILIKRKSPHSVIIIENKSNNAVDQDNQLYRYWLQEMFLPNSDKDLSYTLKEKERYRIIYLSPSESKQLHPKSLLKPNWEWLSKYPQLPESINKDDIQLISFDVEIIEWLGKCLTHINKNYRLGVHIEQYIELWKRN